MKRNTFLVCCVAVILAFGSTAVAAEAANNEIAVPETTAEETAVPETTEEETVSYLEDTDAEFELLEAGDLTEAFVGLCTCPLDHLGCGGKPLGSVCDIEGGFCHCVPCGPTLKCILFP